MFKMSVLSIPNGSTCVFEALISHFDPSSPPRGRGTGAAPSTQFLPYFHFPHLYVALSRMAEGKEKVVLCTRLQLGK